MTEAGPFYVVDDDRENRTIEFVIAEFSRRRYAKDFVGDIAGRILTAREAEAVESVIQAWRTGDYSRQAPTRLRYRLRPCDTTSETSTA